MIDFTTLQGLTIPEGVVTQITDESGNVIWAVQSDKAILEVKKLRSNTYAGETTYENEEFILLDIYPKTNGTVSVTYGGLTKTITDTSGAAEPNAQQVFFGTFNGVSDSVETPESGVLTIEGDYYGVGNGNFATGKLFSGIGTGNIAKVLNFGKISIIPTAAFSNKGIYIPQNFAMATVKIPNSVTAIGRDAFYGCSALTSVIIPDSVMSIGYSPFCQCVNLESIVVDSGNKYYSAEDGVLFNISKTEIIDAAKNIEAYVVPNSVITIGRAAFYANKNLISVTIPESVAQIYQEAFAYCSNLDNVTFAMTGTDQKWWSVRSPTTSSIIVGKLDVTDPVNNAYMIRGTGDDRYGSYVWEIITTS